MESFGVWYEMNKELKNKIEEEKKIKDIQQGRKPGATKQEREIYEALQKLGSEGMELSAIFNIARAKQVVVTTLYNAMKAGNLMERAREVLESYGSQTTDSEKNGSDVDINLKRVCWCLLVNKTKDLRE